MKTQNHIEQFRGEHYFLSNFFPSPVVYDGIIFQNNEAAFQAQKQPEIAEVFASLPLNKAKQTGRQVKLRPDWESVKDTIMEEIVRAKFSQNTHLRKKLIATGNAELIEGNHWGDTYWGVCFGKGRNKLGEILMKIRAELQSQN